MICADDKEAAKGGEKAAQPQERSMKAATSSGVSAVDSGWRCRDYEGDHG